MMQVTRGKAFVAWAALLIGGWAVLGQDSKDAPAKDPNEAKPTPGAKVGASAPDFALSDTAGKTVKLADLQDKLVVLEWMNKDCPWSDKSRPVVAELVKKYGDKIVWLGIDSTAKRKAGDYADYARQRQIAFPVLLDADGQVGRAYGAKTTPHVFVIHKGRLVYAGGLHNNPQEDRPAEQVRQYVDEAVEATLAGKPVPVAETTSWGCNVKYAKEAAKP